MIRVLEVIVVALEYVAVAVSGRDSVHNDPVQLFIVVGNNLAHVISSSSPRDDKPPSTKVRQHRYAGSHDVRSRAANGSRSDGQPSSSKQCEPRDDEQEAPGAPPTTGVHSSRNRTRLSDREQIWGRFLLDIPG